MEKGTAKSYWQLGIGILGGLLSAAIIMLFNSPPRGETVSILPPPTPAPIYVHVTGAVAKPEVYMLPPGCRVQDAIDAAGGLLPEAYTTSLNLATYLHDGDKVLVPYKSPENPDTGLEYGQPASAEETVFPIDINTATQEELEQLPDIGEVKAQAIIDYRESNGPFTAIEQIQRVSGIGYRTFEKIKDLIKVSDTP